MITEIAVVTTGVMTGGYTTLIGVIALIASAHPDDKRRRDAAKILDRLLRVRDRDRS